MSKRSGAFILGGLLVALLLAGVVSNFASAHPDGLDSSLREGCTFDADDNITGGSCPAQEAEEHELADSPLADYGVRGIDNTFLSTGLSGVLGVLITFAVGGGLFWLTRRRPTAAPAAATAAGAGTGSGTPAPRGTGTPAPRGGDGSTVTPAAGRTGTDGTE
ncbi:cobalamin biosynthesis protein CbiM [Plantactinospora sp. BC1]|nr:PDGLE domain-containing protein [Plantactinospora sp. BC1]AVT34414.1 cobalamin biosynthesis protein CbiM [Plantactinospora sp. BC1]